jgi:hypothetical protein
MEVELILVHIQLLYLVTETMCIFMVCVVCGLVVRVPGYRSRGLGSISGATRFSEK